MSIHRRGSIDPRLLAGVVLRLFGLVALAVTLGAVAAYFVG